MIDFIDSRLSWFTSPPWGRRVLGGLFELVLEIRIADSAHDIDYRIQQKRVNAVFGALENFECSADGISVVSFEFELDSDARDDDNIGNVLKYSVIAQI